MWKLLRLNVQRAKLWYRFMNRQPQNNQKPPLDPSRYDMYAAFRTKERANLEKKRTAGEQNYYENYQSRRAQMQGQKQGQKQQNQNRAAKSTQRAVNTAQYSENAAQSNRIQQQRPPSSHKTAPSGSRNQTGNGYGAARVQSASQNSYRYGFHSSYRTADGRILDGFDKTGRPIYRDPFSSNTEESRGTGDVILHSGAGVQRGERRLHPVRRARIVTLANTETKPFPLKIVATVLLCTAMIMAVLYTYMELNVQTTTLSTLTRRLSTLRSQANTLQAEVVRREDLISIEQTASEILGMVKTDVLTKQYISIENEDKTEVVSKQNHTNVKRSVVEIDLDTGKPLDQTQNPSASFTPAGKTEDSGSASTGAGANAGNNDSAQNDSQENHDQNTAAESTSGSGTDTASDIQTES